jgi:hypothetical protein
MSGGSALVLLQRVNVYAQRQRAAIGVIELRSNVCRGTPSAARKEAAECRSVWTWMLRGKPAWSRCRRSDR